MEVDFYCIQCGLVPPRWAQNGESGAKDGDELARAA
jgi:hypothetical protein